MSKPVFLFGTVRKRNRDGGIQREGRKGKIRASGVKSATNKTSKVKNVRKKSAILKYI